MEQDAARFVDVVRNWDWPMVEKVLQKLPPLGTERVDLVNPFKKKQVQEA